MEHRIVKVDTEEQAGMFDKHYTKQLEIDFGKVSPVNKFPSKKVCRFCGKSHPDTTFKEKVHLIPELLGTNKVLSMYECDACNAFFKGYESHLSHFLSSQRTMDNVKKKGKKVPTFKSKDESVRIENVEINGEHFLKVSNFDIETNPFDFDIEKGTVSLKHKVYPYIPLYVYKALVKICLSVLPGDDFTNYNHALNFLMNDAFDPELIQYPINTTLLESKQNFPHLQVILFKKRHLEDRVPTHIVSIYVGNQVINIPLPLNQEDLELFNGQKFSIMYPSPFYTDFYKENAVNYLIVPWKLTSRKHDVREDTISFTFPSGLQQTFGKQDKPVNTKDISEILFSKEKSYFIIPKKPET